MISERAEILKTMRAGPLVLRRLLRSVSDDGIRTKAGDGGWAIIEVVAHLGDTDERALARTERMLAEHEPELAPYDPAQLAVDARYLERDLLPELGRFENVRARYVALLEGLDDDGWSRRGRHGEHGLITVQQLAAHTAGEDGDHLAQIARLVPG